MAAKYKAILRDEIDGVKYTVYKKFLFMWWPIFGYVPLEDCVFLIHKNIIHCRGLYGGNFRVVDKRIIKKPIVDALMKNEIKIY